MKLLFKFFSTCTLVVLMLVAGNLNAQKGILSGKIFDKSSGETLIGAIVEVRKDGYTVTGATTDYDGNYLVQLEPDTYSLSINYLSYAKFQVSDISIRPKETFNLDVALESESVSLGEIIIKADAVRSSEVAVLALQRNASGIQDGVSAQQISRTGSANAADAIRQLPAAVIQDGRFIVVRGLGDRYSISQLNGVTLPGTDPYRNSSSLDLIPGQIIESITSAKTFTPDMPGNFSGGLINIDTKGIPDKFNMSIGVSTSYNSASSLINNFAGHAEGGKLDWLGFDDGSRDQPSLLLDPDNRYLLSSSTYLSARQNDQDAVRNVFHESSRGLSNTFVPEYGNAPLNLGFNFALGHRFPLFNRDFGFTFALNYSTNYQHYENGIVSTFINTNTDFLFPYQQLTEAKSVQNPALGSLLNLSYKLSDHHILSGNIIFNNDAEIIARAQSGQYLGQVSNSLAQFNTQSTEFIQRQMTNYQLSGKHNFPTANQLQVEWNGTITNSFQHEPDLKYFAYSTVTEDPGGGEMLTSYYMNNSEYAFPYHFFRKLTDEMYEGKLDVSMPLFTQRAMTYPDAIKVGGLFSHTTRNFEEYRYQLNNSGVPSSLNFTSFEGDFNAFWNESNFGIIDTLFYPDGTVQRYVTGYHYVNQINARNFYTGSQDITAGYAMLTYNLTRKLRAIGGLRLENTKMEVISADTTLPAGKINLTDFLYSLNLIWSLSENSNLRAAITQTLARPNLRELAPFVQFDTKNGFFNVGNPGLRRTLINNYDLRYEIYPAPGELIAVSAFYKEFNDPIIRAFNPRATIPELSFINVDKAIVLGAEVEFRKALGFIHHTMRNFYFNTNLALIHSSYDIPASEIESSRNIDPEYDQTTRPFQGQAPFIVNAILSYNHPESGTEVSLAYNLSGKKLFNISLFATPDVYEQPVSMLNLKASKRFAKQYQVSVYARNLLNADNQKTLSFHGKEYIAESSLIGRTFGVSLTYNVR